MSANTDNPLLDVFLRHAESVLAEKRGIKAGDPLPPNEGSDLEPGNTCEDVNAIYRSSFYFPPNQQARNISVLEQGLKVLDETCEMLDAVTQNGHQYEVQHLLEEAWDIIQSAEGILRKFPQVLVDDARNRVIDKCRKRGDYPS